MEGCSAKCWYATCSVKRCRCKCEGAHHGAGWGELGRKKQEEGKVGDGAGDKE